MTAPILYCGDTSLDGAAAYLAGLMASWGWDFDYLRSDEVLDSRKLNDRRLVVLSDYPSSNVAGDAQRRLVEAVSAGCGLLMIGGWESFHGAGGDWDQTAIADILPVVIDSDDDRLNCDHPVAIRSVCDHPIVAELPWSQRPPVIGGLNRFTPRPSAQVLLEADRLSLNCTAGQWSAQLIETLPLLVLGEHGAGTTAALATDVAPHWVGGFVDWGTGRVQGQAAGAEAIEVGELYATFWQQLLAHVMGCSRS